MSKLWTLVRHPWNCNKI